MREGFTTDTLIFIRRELKSKRNDFEFNISNLNPKEVSLTLRKAGFDTTGLNRVQDSQFYQRVIKNRIPKYFVTGWVNYLDLKENDEVLTLNRKLKRIEWSKHGIFSFDVITTVDLVVYNRSKVRVSGEGHILVRNEDGKLMVQPLLRILQSTVKGKIEDEQFCLVTAYLEDETTEELEESKLCYLDICKVTNIEEHKVWNVSTKNGSIFLRQNDITYFGYTYMHTGKSL